MVTLSAIYACPGCGCLVQKADRSYGRTAIEDARTGQRHVCIRLPQPERQIRECPVCFEHYSAELLDPRGTRWSAHGCPPVPKYEPRPVPAKVPAPVKVEMAKGPTPKTIETADHRIVGVASDLQ